MAMLSFPLLILPSPSGGGCPARRTEQFSFISQPGSFCSCSQFKACIISRHQSLRASSFAQHKSQLGTPSPPCFQQAPPALPQFSQDRKGKIYTGFARDDPPLPVLVFRAPDPTAGEAQAVAPVGEVKMLQAAWEMQPPSPACLGEAHAGRRQKSLRASQLHYSPPAKERRLAASSRWWAKGKSQVQHLLSPVSAAFCC